MADVTTRADELFQRAVDVPTADRRAFLTVACDGDPELRREVDRLLAAYEWMDEPVTRLSGHDDEPGFAPPTAEGDVGRLGKYRVMKALGRGGMGLVYLAFDERLERQVALKVMLPHVAADASAKARFLREARAAARISSDHVVQIFEADEIDGVPFIAQQYLQGCPLHQHLQEGGPPSVRQVVRVARETAVGLAAAHALGLVHRDIKPANIWLEGGGRVKILDFGLAKPVEVVGDDHITPTGAVLGTPAYMAPEQGMGKSVDGRADLFSLGCVLYQLVTGRVPFARTTLMGTLTAVATEEPTAVRELNPRVPPDLATLVHRLMAKEADDRPASATEVADELDCIARTLDSANGDPTPRGRRWWKRPPVLVGAGLFGVLLAVAGVIVIKITNKDGTVTELKVPDDSTIEVDGKPVTPDPKKEVKDPDRAAAEVLTRHPVKLKLRLASDKLADVWPGQPLPDGPFAVVEIAFQDGEPLPKGYATEVFVPTVAGLKSLTVIQDWWRKLRLSKADLEKLADSPVGAGLTSVDALMVRFTPQTLAVLKKFPKLTGFGMDAAEVDDDLLLRVQKEFPPLTYLLADNLGKSGKVTAKGVAVVTGFPLRVLSLSNWPTVDRQFCRSLAAMPDLTHLFLYDVGIDDDDAAELAKCPKLSATTFTKSRLTDEGLTRLASLSTLRGTDLSGTKVTEDGVKKLSARLPACKISWDGGVVGPK